MRESRENYFMAVVDAVRMRSTCDRGKNGAIIVKDGRIVSTGYAGAPKGAAHCDQQGHLYEARGVVGDQKALDMLPLVTNVFKENGWSVHCVRTVHAEMNALLQAARFGTPVDGAAMYCHSFPCYECAKGAVNAGIAEVVARQEYQCSEDSKRLFDSLSIPWKVLVAELPLYPDSRKS
jgi:dCMP deaminase